MEKSGGTFGAGVLDDDPVTLLSAEGRDGVMTLLKTMCRSSQDFHRKHSFYTKSFQPGVFPGSLSSGHQSELFLERGRWVQRKQDMIEHA